MADIILDEEKLSGENADLVLYQWLSSVEKALGELDSDALKTAQPQLEATLGKIIIVASPFPLPGRPTRRVLARCLILLYTKGDTKNRFDIIQACLRTAADMKASEKDTRVTSLYCLGELMLAFGSQIMSFMTDVTNTSLRIIKSSNSILLRYSAAVTLKKSISTAARALSEGLIRDINKQLKYCISDKALPLQRAGAEALLVLYDSTDSLHTISEIETIVSLIIKNLEQADMHTRRSLARLAAQVLAQSQKDRVVASADIPKKTKKEIDTSDDAMGLGIPSSDISKPLLSPSEMLSQLSLHLQKPNCSRKTKISIINIYATLFLALGTQFVETNYRAIIQHLLNDVLSSPRSPLGAYELLLIKKLVSYLLRDLIGVRLLSEQGQIDAIVELSNSYLKKWPALLPGQTSPSPIALTVALKEVSGLLQQLGNAPGLVQDALVEPLLHLLSHPDYSTHVASAWCLRSFCQSAPLRLPKLVLNVVELLQRDVTSLGSASPSPEVCQRALGHAHGVAALFAVIKQRPLYVAHDISAKVLDMAIQLLKRAGDHDVAVGGAEVEVAWVCISSLMTLGPNFVRGHLPQLLVLWRNALPKPTSKDININSGRSTAEWSFLLQLREAALSAILSFLEHNSPILITLDVARRLNSLLANALAFANAFIEVRVHDGPEEPLNPTGEPTLTTREAALRRRIYQCFTALGFSSISEATQSSLLQSAVSLFASSEGYAGSFVQAAIATSSGNFSTIWRVTDGYAYGLTGGAWPSHSSQDYLVLEGVEDTKGNDHFEIALEQLACDFIILERPILGSCEHDPLYLCRPISNLGGGTWPEPPAATTGVVDAAIKLFSSLLPLQDTGATNKVISLLIQSARSPKLDRNVARKNAVFVNATVAILLALQTAMSTHSKQAKEAFSHQPTYSAMADFLKARDAMFDGDVFIRNASSEALGRLSNLAGTSFLTGQIKFLVDQVVSNRDPHGRAGCALAFGAIFKHVGGLAAGPLLKTTVNVLMSLSNDPHPIVHFWALRALAQVVNAASLSYSPLLSSTLGMLFKVYSKDTHEPEGGTLANVNYSADLPTYQAICQVIDALIGVLGPELKDSARTRTMILDLVLEMWNEEDESVKVDAIKCVQHVLMFGGEFLDIPTLVRGFRTHLSSPMRPLKTAATNALYQLVRLDAFVMSKLGGDRLVEDLFSMLDDDPTVEGVRNIISSWLQQTVIHNPSAWIDLCQRIMSRTTASQQATGAAKNLAPQDDEAESLSSGMNDRQSDQQSSRSTSRWRTQLFALQCLHQICITVSSSGRREHIDPLYARIAGVPTSGLLVTRVPDLIKMAFTASATHVSDIRLEGLVVIRDVIQIFALIRDPEDETALLLEQYQAPITAALTPAFSSDSTPEVLAAAVQVCAVFVGSGIIKDVSRMGRSLKLLSSALEQSKDSGTLSIGDVGELSPSASVMLRVSTLTAWAELQVACSSQTYLEAVVKPFRPSLAGLWVGALRDYASIRADSELVQETSSVAMDASYGGLAREILFPYYESSWIRILKAVASMMAAKDTTIILAMDGRTSDDQDKPVAQKEEPSAYFFVVFGLIYEALSTLSMDANDNSPLETAVAALDTLGYLVRPEFAGRAVLEQPIFDELISLAYRLGMTESTEVQRHLISAIASLASSQRSRMDLSGQTGQNPLLVDSPLGHCLKICAYILRNSIPSRRNRTGSLRGPLDDRIALIKSSFVAFNVIGISFGEAAQDEIRALGVSLYTELLDDDFSEVDLCGPTLPCLKSLLEIDHNGPRSDKTKYDKLVHGLLSACLTHIDEMRGRQGPAITLKVKNNLLATVLTLTVIPPSTKISQAVVEQCCYVISQKLDDTDEISATAAHCAKALLVAATLGSPLIRLCAKLLIPGMIKYVANGANMERTGDISESKSHGIEEILKAWFAFFNYVPDEQRSRLLGVFLPAAVLLLDPTRAPPSGLHTKVVTHLLSFAAASPQAFKDATGRLDAAVKETLEASVRQVVGSKTTSGGQTIKPQISLRSF